MSHILFAISNCIQLIYAPKLPYMIYRKTAIIVSLLIISFSNVCSQTLPQYNFRDPLDIPMYLAGNFGELRTNHFHTGIDIKTESRIGIPIYAVEDGYITRVKVSGSGYGNALYMAHPNGYTSVYAHMDKFTEDIDQYVERAQYRDKTFDINLFPGPDVFSFKRGDLIGYTGNSGSSGGPHLHFELRETGSEHPVNPLLFGFNIKDEIKPSIYGIMVYPLTDSSVVNGKTTPQNFAMGGTFGNYNLKNNERIDIQGEIGIAIHTIDRLTGFPNKCGVYEIKLWIDSTLIYHQKMDELDFDTKRYVNAHKDYAIYKASRKSYHRCYKLPNNKLNIYKIADNDGRIVFNDGEKKLVQVVVTDVYGNASKLQFNMYGKSFSNISSPTIIGHQPMKYDQVNDFIGKEVLFSLPNEALYEDLDFEYNYSQALTNSYAGIHTLHHNNVPIEKYATLKIKPIKTIDQHLKDKALIVQLDDKNRPSTEGGSWDGEYLSTKTREFGNYTIMLDTTPPTIQPLTSIKSRILGNGSQIVFRINDNLAGIKLAEAFVGENWVLLTYDAKYNKVTYTINKKYIDLGSQDFKVVVTDNVGNVTTYDTKIMVK